MDGTDKTRGQQPAEAWATAGPTAATLLVSAPRSVVEAQLLLLHIRRSLQRCSLKETLALCPGPGTRSTSAQLCASGHSHRRGQRSRRPAADRFPLGFLVPAQKARRLAGATAGRSSG
jgi:hypothetical protein